MSSRLIQKLGLSLTESHAYGVTCCAYRYRVVEHSERPLAYAVDWMLQRVGGSLTHLFLLHGGGGSKVHEHP